MASETDLPGYNTYNLPMDSDNEDADSERPKSAEVGSSVPGRRRRVWTTLVVVAGFVVLAVIIGLLIFLFYQYTSSSSPTTNHVGFRTPNETDSGPDIEDGSPMRQTVEGKVTGRLVRPPQGGEDVEEYLGIPYAEAPLGNLRFAKPFAKRRLPQDPYPALECGNSCPQTLNDKLGSFPGTDRWNPKNSQSEDCLHLNVWVPRPLSRLRAVMVWIHGGGFTTGSSCLQLYDARALVAETGVVVVSFNYRLGALGFLRSDTGDIKGNFGLWDQVTALEWVQRNIAAFDGDPSTVTVFSHDAGSASLGLLMISHRSRHLFKRAIFQSGSPDAHWAYMNHRDAGFKYIDFTRNLGCTGQQDSLTCLRRASSADIVKGQVVDTNFLSYPWVPTADGELLIDSPYNLLQNGDFQQKDILIGTTKDEGATFALAGLQTFNKNTPSHHTFTQFLDAIPLMEWDLTERYTVRVRRLYSPPSSSIDPPLGVLHRDALMEICGDRGFFCSTMSFAELVMNGPGGRVFAYHLTYRPSNDVWPPWMGTVHGSEVQWVFGLPMDTTKRFSMDDVSFSKAIMHYWTSFAKTGDPNAGGGSLPHWPMYKDRSSEAAYKYLELRTAPGDFYVRDGRLRNDPYCKLWAEIKTQLNDKWNR